MRPSRVQENLGVPVDALVELLVCVGGLVERDVVGDDEGRLGASGDDEVAEVSVVFLETKLSNQSLLNTNAAAVAAGAHLDVALAGAHGEALLEQLPEREGDVALRRVRVGRAGVAGHVEARDAEPAGGAHDGDEALEDDVRPLGVAVRGDGLVPDRVDAAVDLAPVRVRALRQFALDRDGREGGGWGVRRTRRGAA